MLVVLLCADPACTRMLATVLVDLFGMTPIDAQLALLILEGLTVAEAARVRGVTTKTARAEWQTVLWKVAADHERSCRCYARRWRFRCQPPDLAAYLIEFI